MSPQNRNQNEVRVGNSRAIRLVAGVHKYGPIRVNAKLAEPVPRETTCSLNLRLSSRRHCALCRKLAGRPVCSGHESECRFRVGHSVKASLGWVGHVPVVSTRDVLLCLKLWRSSGWCAGARDAGSRIGWRGLERLASRRGAGANLGDTAWSGGVIDRRRCTRTANRATASTAGHEPSVQSAVTKPCWSSTTTSNCVTSSLDS
jgi:hypothetical protein